MSDGFFEQFSVESHAGNRPVSANFVNFRAVRRAGTVDFVNFARGRVPSRE
jgi:hypothetical protein